jgi:hypothetical protein
MDTEGRSVTVADAGVNLELVQLSALIGTGLPVLAAVVKQDRFSQRTNTIIAALLAMSTALAVTVFRHELSPENLFTSFTALYTTAVAFHHGLWKPTGFAPKLQRRTSRRRPRTAFAASPIRPVAARWEPTRAATDEDPDRRADLARC